MLPLVNPRDSHAYLIDVHTGLYKAEVKQLRDKQVMALPSSFHCE